MAIFMHPWAILIPTQEGVISYLPLTCIVKCAPDAVMYAKDVGRKCTAQPHHLAKVTGLFGSYIASTAVRVHGNTGVVVTASEVSQIVPKLCHT